MVQTGPGRADLKIVMNRAQNCHEPCRAGPNKILTLNSHNKVRGHRTDSSHSGAEEYPREKHINKPKVVHAYVTADAIHASTRNM